MPIAFRQNPQQRVSAKPNKVYKHGCGCRCHLLLSPSQMSDSDTSRTSFDLSLTLQSLGDEHYIQQRFCVVLDLLGCMGECYCSYLDSLCFAHDHSVRASSFIVLCFAHLWPYLLYMSKGVGYEWKHTFGWQKNGDSFNHWWLNWSTDNAKS